MSKLISAPLIERIVCEPAFLYSGVRKIVQNQTWEIDGDTFCDHTLTYSELGYGKNKEKQLIRNYIDPQELERIQQILKKRKDHQFTSVAMLMRGGKKDSRSMGWCMLNTIITGGPKLPTVVEVQYRSTELILKFGADLVFIRNLLKQLKVEPEFVRFRFANAYLSGVFMPTYCRFHDPIEFLESLWKNDRKLFSGGTRFFLRSTYKENQRFPYSPENQQHKFLWKNFSVKEIKRIRDYLHAKHEKIGKPLPTIHHPLESDDE